MFLLPTSHWEIRKTKSKGKGVFAKNDIEAGTIIGDYLGKIISADEEEEYEEKYGFYSMYYHDNASIFPNIKDPGIHLINHSCAPNCWMYTYRGHTLYFAIRKIFKGEELTVSYMLHPQDKDCAPCDDLCYCKSFNCTQTMHTTKEKYDAWVTFDDQKEKETKKERVKVGTFLPKLDLYPKSIPDNPIYILIANQDHTSAIFPDTKLPSLGQLRKLIRKKGQNLRFNKLNITVRGIDNNIILAS